jgi:sec-independent protein translocase protein TatC
VPRSRIRPVQHDDRLTVVEHLDELRTRLIVTASAFVVAFAVCFWQNDFVLDVMNEPLDGKEPITFGVAEPFTVTIMVSAYAAILLSLPVILYQLYAFVLPAFSPEEKKVAMPLLLMVPFLFIGGVVFGYFVVLPSAVDFLQDFNADNFAIEIRAREYYSFVALTLLVIGVLYQIPVGVLAASRLGLATPEKLRKNRRYAIVILAVVAMLLPGTDPVTMLLALVPLLVLYELSILLAVAFGRPREEAGEGAGEEIAPVEGS